MEVRVRLFAGLRERAGTGTVDVELPEAATVADVWPAVAQVAPLGDQPAGVMFAVNRAYAEPAQELAEGDEVALIPPVSGGSYRLFEVPLSLDAAVEEVRTEDAGAIATVQLPARVPLGFHGNWIPTS